MRFVIVDGEPKDIKLKGDKRVDQPYYVVYVGDKVIAQLYGSTGPREWTIVIAGKTDHPRLVEGFATRDWAISYALKALGYHKD